VSKQDPATTHATARIRNKLQLLQSVATARHCACCQTHIHTILTTQHILLGNKGVINGLVSALVSAQGQQGREERCSSKHRRSLKRSSAFASLEATLLLQFPDPILDCLKYAKSTKARFWLTIGSFCAPPCCTSCLSGNAGRSLDSNMLFKCFRGRLILFAIPFSCV